MGLTNPFTCSSRPSVRVLQSTFIYPREHVRLLCNPSADPEQTDNDSASSSQVITPFPYSNGSPASGAFLHNFHKCICDFYGAKGHRRWHMHRGFLGATGLAWIRRFVCVNHSDGWRFRRMTDFSFFSSRLPQLAVSAKLLCLLMVSPFDCTHDRFPGAQRRYFRAVRRCYFWSVVIDSRSECPRRGTNQKSDGGSERRRQVHPGFRHGREPVRPIDVDWVACLYLLLCGGNPTRSEFVMTIGLLLKAFLITTPTRARSRRERGTGPCRTGRRTAAPTRPVWVRTIALRNAGPPMAFRAPPPRRGPPYLKLTSQFPTSRPQSKKYVVDRFSCTHFRKSSLITKVHFLADK